MKATVKRPGEQPGRRPLKLVSLDKLARRLPGVNSQHLHPNTLLRWHRNGLLVHGQRVRLMARKIGGRWYSTGKWLKAFVTVTSSPDPVHLPEPAETRKATREREAVDAELRRRGYL